MLADTLLSLPLIAERRACRGPRHVVTRTRGRSVSISDYYREDRSIDTQIWSPTGQGDYESLVASPMSTSTFTDSLASADRSGSYWARIRGEGHVGYAPLRPRMGSKPAFGVMASHKVMILDANDSRTNHGKVARSTRDMGKNSKVEVGKN